MKTVSLHDSIFYNGDCITGAAARIPDNSVDLIITDPPYGIAGDTLHKHYNRDEAFVYDGYVEVPPEEYADFSFRWIREAERVLRPGGSIYIVSGYTNLVDILNALGATSLREVNHIIWKYSFGVFTRRKFISSHYHILFYEKPGGRRTFHPESRYGLTERDEDGRSPNNTDREDVWVINREYKPGRLKNKNELPGALLAKMIQYSSSEGDLVCDFFLGGFSTAKVAIGLNRRAIGFEISGPLFAAKTAEIAGLQPGYLVSSLRTPVTSSIINQGARWTSEEIDHLVREYHRLTAEGMTKKAIIARLGEELGRGRWAIEKALKQAGASQETRMTRSQPAGRRDGEPGEEQTSGPDAEPPPSRKPGVVTLEDFPGERDA
ncbi:MAG: site-specific DNA-methyltransferase [Methanoregulaceae archaeon]|jgi:site-specific DNA-methyltransferase (adenine-specific)